MKVSRPFRLAPRPPWLVAPLIVMSLALLGSRSAFRPEPTVARTVVNSPASSPGHQATRIIIQTGGKVHTQASGRLQNPERVYFDLLGAQMVGHGKGDSILVGDELLQRVRISRREGKITRVVLDLLKPAHVVASQIDDPDRFMIEVRPDVPAPAPSQVATQPRKPREIESAAAIPPKLTATVPSERTRGTERNAARNCVGSRAQNRACGQGQCAWNASANSQIKIDARSCARSCATSCARSCSRRIHTPATSAAVPTCSANARQQPVFDACARLRSEAGDFGSGTRRR